MAGLLAALRPEPQAGPSESTKEVPRKKIPKVAVYVSGATFAITLGLTALILPYARQAAKLARPPPEFRSNTHLLLKRPPRQAEIESSSSSRISSIGRDDPIASMTSPTLDQIHDGQLSGMEGELEKEEPMSGFMAFQALGIATAVVFGSAGLGAWAVAKLLGVDDMEGFASKMREGLDMKMPGLTGGMRKYGKEHDELADLLDDMAMEPEELELQRTLREGSVSEIKPS